MKPLILCALLALSGCATIGADFVEPKLALAPAWRNIEPAPVHSMRLPAEWWTVFNDSTLDELERRAVRDNAGVRASAQRLLQAEAQLSTLRAAQGPSVNVGASVASTRSSALTAQSLALGGRAIEGNNYTLGASLSYELDLWGRVRRVVEAADAQALATQYDRDGVVLLLSAQVAAIYWQLRGLEAEQAILRDASGARREAQEVVEARFNGGLTNELDVARARVERANAEADLIEVQRQRNLLENALSVLVGVAPNAPLIASLAQAALPQPPAIPAGLPASLLSRRPDLAASMAGLRAANAQVAVAEGAFYPALSLTGNFGYASESLGDLFKSGARQFSVGPLALSLPVFDGGRNQANLAQSKARYGEALANHEGRLLGALREVEDALSDVQQRRKQADVQAQSQQAAARAVLVARARYERGLSTYLEVTDAQRSSLAADRTAAQISTQRLLATVAVARALGAGWTPQAPVATIARK